MFELFLRSAAIVHRKRMERYVYTCDSSSADNCTVSMSHASTQNVNNIETIVVYKPGLLFVFYNACEFKDVIIIVQSAIN